MSQLEVSVNDHPDHTLVVLSGDAGVAAADHLARELMGLTARQPNRVIFDLQGLSFISSIVLGTLVSFQQAVHRRGGAVKFACVQAAVAAVFERAKLKQVFSCHDSIDLALAAARPAGNA